jgi:hypothetical protein
MSELEIADLPIVGQVEQYEHESGEGIVTYIHLPGKPVVKIDWSYPTNTEVKNG